MPELPEVETVRQGLAPHIEGARIENVVLNRDGLRWPFPLDMRQRLEGCRVERITRRSKYLLFELNTRETWLVHLGMSGRFSYEHRIAPKLVHQNDIQAKHDHVIVTFQNGLHLRYNDPRRFGAMDIIAENAICDHKLLAKIGPEPLENAFHGAYLFHKIAHRQQPIKNLLLDQKIVAGLGNIYVCESLHKAKISPSRKGLDITKDQANHLVTAIVEVLRAAIEAGGSSLRDYRQADGALGYFQHQFAVYGREKDACHTEDCSGVITKIVQAGRSSFYCPSCQR